jgi:transposase
VLCQAGLPKAERTRQASIVDPYHPMIIDTLEKHPRLFAARLFVMAQERGYCGGPSQFRAHVARLRPRRSAEAYLRLRTLPGDQAQVDWARCRARHRAHYAESRTMPSRCIWYRYCPGYCVRFTRHSLYPSMFTD